MITRAYILLLILACIHFAMDATAQRLLGNGNLAVHFSPSGAMDSLLWPGVGGAQQLHQNSPHFFADNPRSIISDAQWGIAHEREITWQQNNLNGVFWDQMPGYLFCRSTTTTDNPTREFFVLPVAQNAVAIRLEIFSGDNTPKFYWFQDFSPVTKQDNLANYFTLSRDFAAFYDEAKNTLYQFRPDAPASLDRDRAIKFAEEQATPEKWSGFGNGAWIATRSTEKITACRIVTKPFDESILSAEYMGQSSTSAYGDVAAFLEIEAQHPATSLSAATVYIAVGKSMQDVDQTLDKVTAHPFDQLINVAENEWQVRTENLIPDHFTDSTHRKLYSDALDFLHYATDYMTGAVVHAPNAGGALYAANASVWPTDVAWITEAFLALGKTENAERLLDFYLRDTYIPPTAMIQPESDAHLLMALWRYSEALPPEEQVAYLEKVSDVVQRSSFFLAQMFNANTDEIAPSFQPDLLRDARSNKTLAHVYLGLLSARKLLDLQGESEPAHLADSIRACESQIRFSLLNDPDPWPLPPSITWWMDLFLPDNHPLWKVQIQLKRKVQSLAQSRPIQDGDLSNLISDDEVKNVLEAAQVIVTLHNTAKK